MAYRNNDGCGCILAFIIVMAILTGIERCSESLINGEFKLPKFGSGHVHGGSGGYGTSNGYNVKYNQTTSPNTNSSLRDYTHTNSQPTEYREGKSMQHSNSNANTIGNTSSSYSSGNNSSSTSGSSSSSSINSISTNSNTQQSNPYYKPCTVCNGSGKRHTFHWFYENAAGSSCFECGRTDSHRHDEIITCEACSGEGKSLVK